jgi:hypothetical protein
MFKITYRVVVSFTTIGVMKVDKFFILLSTSVLKLGVRNFHKMLLSVCSSHANGRRDSSTYLVGVNKVIFDMVHPVVFAIIKV